MVMSTRPNGAPSCHRATSGGFLLIAMAIHVGGLCPNCLGEDVLLSEDHDRDGVNFVIKGVMNRIESLQSGEAAIRFLTATPQKSDETPCDWIPSSVYRYTFDYSQNHVLFEHTLADNDGSRTLKTLTTDASRMFYEAPRSGPGSVTTRPVSWMTEIPEAIPIDFRIAGIVGWGEICTHATFDDCKSKYWLNPGLYQKVSLDRDEPSGLVTLVMIHTDRSGAEWPLVISIDERKQYAPVEVRRFFRPPPGAEHPESSSLKTLSKISTSWTEKDGIWVPDVWIVERGLEPPVKFEFDWKAVNSQFDKRTFTMEGMDLPNGTLIVNRLGNEAIIEGVIGEPVPLIIGESNTLRANVFPLLLSLNLTCVGTALLIYLWRKRRTGQDSV